MPKEIRQPETQHPPMTEDFVVFQKIIEEAPKIMERIEEKLLEEQKDIDKNKHPELYGLSEQSETTGKE